MIKDSKEKILEDWKKPIEIESLNRSVKMVIFRTFDELYKYLKMVCENQGRTKRFDNHPYDNFKEYTVNKSKYNENQLKIAEDINRKDKIIEKKIVSKQIEFLRRIRAYKKWTKNLPK